MKNFVGRTTINCPGQARLLLRATPFRPLGMKRRCQGHRSIAPGRKALATQSCRSLMLPKTWQLCHGPWEQGLQNRIQVVALMLRRCALRTFCCARRLNGNAFKSRNWQLVVLRPVHPALQLVELQTACPMRRQVQRPLAANQMRTAQSAVLAATLPRNPLRFPLQGGAQQQPRQQLQQHKCPHLRPQLRLQQQLLYQSRYTALSCRQKCGHHWSLRHQFQPQSAVVSRRLAGVSGGNKRQRRHRCRAT